MFCFCFSIFQITFCFLSLSKGHTWLEITFSLLARGCLRICYCILILFTSELYPTSIRAFGLAIGLSADVLAQILVELLLYFSIDRILLLFLSGGLVCLSCCLIFPLPETILFDLPDTLNDLQSMKGRRGTTTTTTTNEKNDEILSHYHMGSPNTLTYPRSTTTETNNFSPKISQRPNQTIHLHSNASSLNGLSNPCYFQSCHDTSDRFDTDIQTQFDGHNNNNNNNSEHDREDTKF